MSNRKLVTVDPDGTMPLALGKQDFWLPTKQNEERAELVVPTGWLLRQTCPEHPEARHRRGDGRLVGFASYRAHWVKEERRWRAAVMLLCPTGHVWEILLPDVV